MNIEYNKPAKLFHWLIAILIFGLLLVGLYMGTMPNGPDKFQIYMLHKSFGLMVLWLAGLRILWRLYSKSPAPIPTQKPWEKLLAKLTHIFLYIAMFGMPLSGWVMSSAAEYPVSFFGLAMPDIVGKNADLASMAKEAHEIIAFLLIATIFLHTLGAFKHHIFDRDMTLNRMIPRFLNSIWPLVLMFVVILFGLGILRISLLEDNHKEEVKISTSSIEQSDDNLKKNINAHDWNIVKDQSQINFTGNVYQKKFEAKFSDFGGAIIFNPDDLPSSKADIYINLKTVNSADAERDVNMMGVDWFNVSNYPMAKFQSSSFEAQALGKYIVKGDLTMAGKTMPIAIPFNLDIVEHPNQSRRAFVEGEFVINRLDFGLGGEKWRTTDIVDQNVLVNLRLVAEN